MLSGSECLEILELGPDADQYEIENRYTMLIKRYRKQNDPESVARLDQITLAYNILTKRHVEPEPADPRLETVVFGKTRRQWQNIWHYGRWAFFASLVGLIFLIYLVYTLATNKPPDFQIAVTGLYTATDDAEAKVKAYVQGVFPEMDNIEFQVLPMDMRQINPTTGDSTADGTSASAPVQTAGNFNSQNQYAYAMKMVAMIAADTIEVFICDKPVFEQYAPQGAYADLSGLYERLKNGLPADIYAKIKPLRRKLATGTKETAANAGAADETSEMAAEADLSLPIGGLDVSELNLTAGLGLSCDTQILTVGFKAGDAAKTEQFLEFWIRDYEKMQQQANQSG